MMYSSCSREDFDRTPFRNAMTGIIIRGIDLAIQAGSLNLRGCLLLANER